MEYVLEEVVGGRTGLAGLDYVPYVLDEVRVGGDLSGVPLGVSGVLTGGVFQDVVLEDARERLASQYGASGVGGLVAAWGGPGVAVWGVGGGRRGRVGRVGRAKKDEETREITQSVYCVSVHGVMRRELRLWRLACGGGGGDATRCCHVILHEVPVEAVYVSHASEEGGQGEETTVLVAVRSISSVVYYRVLYEKTRRGLGADGRLVRLEGGVGVGIHGDRDGYVARLRDFSWSQFSSLSSSLGIMDGVVLDDEGMLREVRAEISPAPSPTSSTSRSYDGACVVDAYRCDQRQHQQHHLGARRCVASPLHPRLNLVAWEGGVVQVDFREKQQPHARVVCDVAGRMQGTFVTALAVPSRVGQGGWCDLRRFAISTSSHVHLYDMRRTVEPLVSWEHYMKYPREDKNTSTSRPPRWDMQTCFPDGLHFVEDRLLVTNSVLGKGVVCAWRVVEAAPRIGFEGGAQRWIEEDQCVEARGDAETDIDGMVSGGQLDNLRFIWRPVSLERLEAIEPPQLLYSDIYPEPAMPTLINKQTSKLMEIEYRREYADDSGGVVRKRVLPAKNPPVVRRDFGQAVAGSTLIRYGTFGELLVGCLTPSRPSDVSGGSAGSDAGADRSRDAPKVVREVEVAIESPSELASIPFDHMPNIVRTGEETQRACPIHEWLTERARNEISSGATDRLPMGGMESVTIDGVPATQLRSLLLHLIERLDGIPISAYEAWDILQKHATAQDPQHARRIVEDEIRLFLNVVDGDWNGSGRIGGGGGVDEGRQADHDAGGRHANAHSRARRSRPHNPSAPAMATAINVNENSECESRGILASHLLLKHLLPILKTAWTTKGAEENQQDDMVARRAQRIQNERMGQEGQFDRGDPGDQRTLTPSRAFLTVWASLDQRDGVLSSRGRDPRAVQRSIEQLAALDLVNIGKETGGRGGTDDGAIRQMPGAASTVVEAAVSFKSWTHAGQSNARHHVRYVRDQPVASEAARRKLEALRERCGSMPPGAPAF